MSMRQRFSDDDAEVLAAYVGGEVLSKRTQSNTFPSAVPAVLSISYKICGREGAYVPLPETLVPP